MPAQFNREFAGAVCCSVVRELLLSLVVLFEEELVLFELLVPAFCLAVLFWRLFQHLFFLLLLFVRLEALAVAVVVDVCVVEDIEEAFLCLRNCCGARN